MKLSISTVTFSATAVAAAVAASAAFVPSVSAGGGSGFNVCDDSYGIQAFIFAAAGVGYPGMSCNVLYGPEEGHQSSNKDHKVTAAAGVDGWQCFEQGTRAECPYGEGMIGLCSSDKSGDECQAYCPSNGPRDFAIKCAVVDQGKYVFDSGSWNAPVNLDLNDPTLPGCSEAKTVCGMCTSNGDNKSCFGAENQFKCKCYDCPRCTENNCV